MNASIVATIAGKDLRVLAKRRSVRLSIVIFPLAVAVGLPLVLYLGSRRNGGMPAGTLPGVLNAFMFVFVLGATALPTAIAACALVGEKVERSLEPLLATPASDGEILLGKMLAAVVPPIVVTWVSGCLFMALCDALTEHTVGRTFFPNTVAVTILFAVCPLAALMAVMFDVIASSRVTDVRAAQQLGSLTALPFFAIYLTSEIRLLTLDVHTMLIMCAALVVVDAALYRLSRATFRREEILTRWK